MFVLTKSKRT